MPNIGSDLPKSDSGWERSAINDWAILPATLCDREAAENEIAEIWIQKFVFTRGFQQ
jgi:hypothetical protein